MTQFFALLRLQLLSRFADLKPKNLKSALREKRGRTVGVAIAFIFLFIYLGVILYIIETKALDFLMSANMADVLLVMAVVLSTAGTLVMAFFFIMSSLYLGRDAVFLASMPIGTRTLLSAKLAQVWISETLIDAVIILPACILYGTRTGQSTGFYFRMGTVWLLAAVLPICAAAILSAFLIRISVLWKRRELFMTVGGFALFIAYMILMMNVGSITGDSAAGGEMIRQFFLDNSVRISGMTQMFPPAGWAVRGMEGDWGQLALYAAASIAAAALVIAVLGVFYRKLALLQSETPQASGKKGIRKGSIREGSAFLANVRREALLILRVPSYAINILPIVFMPVMMIVVLGMSFSRNAGDGSLADLLGQLNRPEIVMCAIAAFIAYMSGMNPALSTAVTREGRGHDFIKALPVSPKTMIHAKFAVGYSLELFGVLAASVAMAFLLKGFYTEILMAFALCAVFCFGCACLALSRDVKKPKLDWVTEQEAVKQNFGVMISMLISWGILIALAGLSYLMISSGWGIIPVFVVLLAVLTALACGMYMLLMKNVSKYYCAG